MLADELLKCQLYSALVIIAGPVALALSLFLSILDIHRRTAPVPFVGVHKTFCPNFVFLPESRICVGNAFCRTCGGGGGVLEEANITTLLK